MPFFILDQFLLPSQEALKYLLTVELHLMLRLPVLYPDPHTSLPLVFLLLCYEHRGTRQALSVLALAFFFPVTEKQNMSCCGASWSGVSSVLAMTCWALCVTTASTWR